MKALISLFIGLLMTSYTLQAQNCDQVRYQDFVNKGKTLVEEGKYVEAMQYYNSAKDYCPAKAKEVDELLAKLVEKIEKEKKQLDSALKASEDAKKMIEKEKQKAFNLADKNQRFADAVSFSQTDYLAAVLGKNNRYGYMDTTGKIVIDYQFPRASNFNFGIACVDKDLYVDISGSVFQTESIEDLIDTKIQEYPEIDSLTTVSFSNWDLTQIPSNISLLKNLNSLLLRDNNFFFGAFFSSRRLLNEDFSNLENLEKLETLDLSDNYLYQIPKGIQKLKLTELYMDNCKLGDSKFTVTTTLGVVTVVTLLGSAKEEELVLANGDTLTRTEIKGIVAPILLGLTTVSMIVEIFRGIRGEKIKVNRLPNIEGLLTLSLANNHLRIPRKIYVLKKLETLNLSNNGISLVPKSLTKIQTLRSLDLSNNNIRKLPKNIHQLSNLEYLNLADNILKEREEERIKKSLPNCKINFQQSYSSYNHCYYFETKQFDKGYESLIFQKEDNQYNLDYWYELSLFALYVNQPKIAIEAANTVLKLNYEKWHQSIVSRLALGYILSNEWEKAETIYKEWQGKKFLKTSSLFGKNMIDCNTFFINGIISLENEGIYHPDFEKAKKLLIDNYEQGMKIEIQKK